MQDNDDIEFITLQQFANKIKDEIVAAGGYQIESINVMEDEKAIQVEIINHIGQKMFVTFCGECLDEEDEKNGEVKKIYIDHLGLGSEAEFTNGNSVLEYLRNKLQSDAWKNFFHVIDCRAKITDVISNSKSYKLNNDDYIKENGLNNGIRMNVTNEAGRKMDICVKRKTNGQWYVMNETIDTEGRTFDNLHYALQYLDEKLKSNEWKNYVDHQVDVNNGQANFQSQVQNQGNHYNGPK